VRAAVPLAARCGCRWWRRTRCSSSTPDDFEAHEARVCVAEGETLANPRRVKRFTREQYFKTQAQMEALFADLPSASPTRVEIAQRCNLRWCSASRSCPTSRRRGRRRADADGDYFRIASHEGLEQRLRSCTRRGERERERRATSSGSSSRSRPILKMGFPATSSSWPTSSTGPRPRLPGRARGAARAPARWSRTRSTSPASTRCSTTCCSSAS
jgi:DNA polymerase-3 subunit alpha